MLLFTLLGAPLGALGCDPPRAVLQTQDVGGGISEKTEALKQAVEDEQKQVAQALDEADRRTATQTPDVGAARLDAGPPPR